jgi:hypothetical protein
MGPPRSSFGFENPNYVRVCHLQRFADQVFSVKARTCGARAWFVTESSPIIYDRRVGSHVSCDHVGLFQTLENQSNQPQDRLLTIYISTQIYIGRIVEKCPTNLVITF